MPANRMMPASRFRPLIPAGGGAKVVDPGDSGGGQSNPNPLYMRAPGVQDAMASTPHKASFDAIATAGFTTLCRVALDDWTPTATNRLGGLFDATATGVFRQSVLAAGLLSTDITSNGTSTSTGATSVAVPAADGTTIWIKAYCNPTSGQMYYSWAPDSVEKPTTWTVVQNNRGAFTFPLWVGTSPLYVGSVLGSTVPGKGNFYRYMLFSGTETTGTLLADFNVADNTDLGTSWVSSTTGETWSLMGAATIVTDAANGGGGGVVTPPTIPDAPTTDTITGWTLQATTNFKAKPVGVGGVLADPFYGGTASANDIGKMKMNAYGTTAHDTRWKHGPEVSIGSCKIASGQAVIYGPFTATHVNRAITGTGLPSGTFSTAFAATGPDIAGMGTGPRLTLNRAATATSSSMTAKVNAQLEKRQLPGLTLSGNTFSMGAVTSFIPYDVGRTINAPEIPPHTTIVSCTATGGVMSAAAITDGPATSANIGPDYGLYSSSKWYVSADGILHCPMWTDDAGVHWSAAPRPKLNGVNSVPYGVPNGIFEVGLRLPILSTRKVAFLLWPDSDHSTSGTTAPSPPGTGTGGNGEIDGPEVTLDGLSNIACFMHWQDGGADRPQSGGSVGLKLVGDGLFHIYTFIWDPNPDRVSSSLIFKVDGVVKKTFTGFNVPNQKMHWVLQCEAMIDDYVNHLNPSDAGDIEFAYIAYWKKNGTLAGA